MNKNELSHKIEELSYNLYLPKKDKHEDSEKLNKIKTSNDYDIILRNTKGDVFYAGRDDYHDIAHAVHDYLNTNLSEFDNIGVNRDELLKEIKCYALMNVLDYSLEQAEKIDERTLGIMLMRDDILDVYYNELSNEYYHNLKNNFIK